MTISSIIGNAQKLVELVNYQDGSVVSKEIIKNDRGTVTLFAFDKGQGLSEHTAPFDAVVYNFDGKAEVTIDGKAHVLGTGDIMIMPANKSHALQAIERFKMLLIMVRL
jgi:quercetin dioxygenase-like cupin family protein